jgi:hypothetical protein
MKKIGVYFTISMALLLLAGCQVAGPTPTPPPGGPVDASSNLASTSMPALNAFPTQGSAALPTLVPTAEPSQDPTAPAIQGLMAYFDALQAGDSAQAAALTSTYSLMVDAMTRNDWAADLHTQMEQGTKWSGLQVAGAEKIDAHTVLVHVTFQLAKKDSKTGAVTQTSQDEQWPMRRDAGSGQWLYNRGNLIDFRAVDVPAQTTAGLLVQPLRLVRYSDHLSLVFLAQNRTNEAIVLGQTNEVLATFVFGDQKAEATQTRLIFDRLRSYPSTAIDVPGLFRSYPDSVEIRRWKNTTVPPWFVFQFSSEMGS